MKTAARRLVSTASLALALALAASGCSTTARWTAGATLATDAERPRRDPASVAVSFKESFGLFERTSGKQPYACHSVTLLRRMYLVPGKKAASALPGEVEKLAELTTDEYPRDEDQSEILGRDFTRILGIGTDETELFTVVPSAWSVEKGVERLREMAAALGADEVRDVYYTGYAEHQMWEGDAISLEPTSTSSPIFVSGTLLTFRLRDVRFHGTAVRKKEEAR